MHYSTLLNNQKLLDRLGGIDGFTTGLNGLVAQGLVEIHHEYDPSEGDDIEISATKLGKSYLSFKERETE